MGALDTSSQGFEGPTTRGSVPGPVATPPLVGFSGGTRLRGVVSAGAAESPLGKIDRTRPVFMSALSLRIRERLRPCAAGVALGTFKR